ncbi:hypothetical protein GCM10023196_035270 [Actinoallomurus vinaceus]|uniref:Uncharacterized protein n=1 Tax=Actinoallomurus vinaceus TaxID=1080074 RepID=A0ABP8UCG5_9ACTN
MTAATLTPSATAADLLDELRQLLGRHDGASTLDDVDRLADELTAALRRARGRLARLKRQAAKPEPKHEPEPPAAARAASAPEGERPAPPAERPRPTFAAPAPPPQPMVIEIRPDKPTSDPPPPPQPREPEATPDRRDSLAAARLVLAVLAVLWRTLTGPTRLTLRPVARGARKAVRRAVADVRPYARRVRAAARRELDRWLS